MIKNILLICFAILTLGCSTNTPKYAKISSSEKIKIYYIHREGCPACIYMDNILSTQEIKSIIDSRFTLIDVDINAQEILPKSTMITGTTPTFYYLNSKNQEVAEPNHTLELDRFKQKLNSIR